MSQSPSSITSDWTYEQRFEPIKDLGGPAPHINIITSDECTLKVSAKVLSDASPVFKDMIETCTNDETTASVELTDKIERSFFVKMFICLLMAEEDDHLAITDQEEQAVRIAQKYQCQDLLIRIELAIYRRVSSDLDYASCAMCVSATLGAWALCGQIIGSLDEYADKRSGSFSYLQSIVDPKTWCLRDMELNNRYGTLFVWGLTRSGIEAYHPDTGMNYKHMGRIFTHIMAEGKKCDTYHLDVKELRKIAPHIHNRGNDKRRKLDTGETSRA